MNIQTKFKPHRLTELNKLLPVSERKNLFDYERFLYLLQLYPGLKAVPTKDIDSVWHFHISIPELYNKDCNALFGKKIIHEEVQSETEENVLRTNYSLTNKLWFKKYLSQMGEMKNMALCGVGDTDNADE